MTINSEIIRKALSFYHIDSQMGLILQNPFIELEYKIRMNALLFQKHQELCNYLSYTMQDIWNIESVLSKLNYLNSLRIEKKLDDLTYIIYATTDVEFFFTELRSIFDYVSLSICYVSPINKHQIRDEGRSFESLSNWLTKNNDCQTRFSKDLSDLVLSCEWFSEIKDLRDLIRHRGGQSLVFINGDEILFQVFTKGFKPNTPMIPELMFNSNVMNFKFCSVFYFSYLLDYLEKVAKIIEVKLGLIKNGLEISYSHPAHPLVKSWSEELLSHIECN